ncbi:MAG: oligosaccharide flippase family protein, partial [Acidobacteriota bacterium]
MSTTRETFKHAAVYSFSAVLGRMISFFMLPFYAHILRDLGYGVIGMIDACLSLLMSLFSYGVRGSITRFYHDEEEPRKNLVVSTAVILYGAVSLAIVLFLMLLSRPLSQLLLGEVAHWKLICLAMLTFNFEITGQAASAILLIRRRSLAFSLVSLFRLFLGLSLNIYLVIILRWGLLGYFLGSLITALASAIWFYAIAFRECGVGFDREIARKLIAFQAPLIPGSLAAFFSRQIERVIIRFQIGLDAVGVLEMGYKFPALLGMLISEPFMRSWNTKRTEIAPRPEAPRQIGQVFTHYLFLMVFAGLLMAVCIEDVLQILTPPEFWFAHRIARLEIVTFILAGAAFHLGF